MALMLPSAAFLLSASIPAGIPRLMALMASRLTAGRPGPPERSSAPPCGCGSRITVLSPVFPSGLSGLFISDNVLVPCYVLDGPYPVSRMAASAPIESSHTPLLGVVRYIEFHYVSKHRRAFLKGRTPRAYAEQVEAPRW